MKRSGNKTTYDLIGFPLLSVILGPPIGGFLLGVVIFVPFMLMGLLQYAISLAGIVLGTPPSNLAEVVQLVAATIKLPFLFGMLSYVFGLLPASITAGIAVIWMLKRSRLWWRDIILMSSVSAFVAIVGYFVVNLQLPESGELIWAFAIFATSVVAAHFTYIMLGNWLSVDTNGYFDGYRGKRLLAEAPKP